MFCSQDTQSNIADVDDLEWLVECLMDLGRLSLDVVLASEETGMETGAESTTETNTDAVRGESSLLVRLLYVGPCYL